MMDTTRSDAPRTTFPAVDAEMVEPFGGGTGIRFKIRNVKIDGRTNTVLVPRGGTYSVSFDVLHDCSECGSAINQVIVGLAGQDQAQASVWNGMKRSGGKARVVNSGTGIAAAAEDNRGPAEWVNVSCDLVIPDEPGVYEVRARYAQDYQGRLMTAEGRELPQVERQDVLGWWKVDRPNGPGPESTIGAIIVEGSTSGGTDLPSLHTSLEWTNMPVSLDWTNVPAAQGTDEHGALRIVSGPGTDHFVDPSDGATTASAPLLLGPVSGDFQLSARVSSELASTFDAGTLFAYSSPTTWAKLALERSPQGVATVVSVVTRGLSDDSNHVPTDAAGTWLRISRTGTAFAFHTSSDGERWHLVRYFALDDGDGVRVGFGSQSPMGPGCTALFDDIRFTPEGLTDPRDGS